MVRESDRLLVKGKKYREKERKAFFLLGNGKERRMLPRFLLLLFLCFDVWFQGFTIWASVVSVCALFDYPKTQEFMKTQPGDTTSAGTCTLSLFPPELLCTVSLSSFHQCQITFTLTLTLPSDVTFLCLSPTFWPPIGSTSPLLYLPSAFAL